MNHSQPLRRLSQVIILLLAPSAGLSIGFQKLLASPRAIIVDADRPSLDHAAWFHQRVHADEWCWNDLQPIVNANARALYRGTITSHTGAVAITLMQEMSMRPNPAFWQTAQVQ